MKYLALLVVLFVLPACQPLGPEDNPLFAPRGNDPVPPEAMGRFGPHSEFYFHN